MLNLDNVQMFCSSVLSIARTVAFRSAPGLMKGQLLRDWAVARETASLHLSRKGAFTAEQKSLGARCRHLVLTLR